MIGPGGLLVLVPSVFPRLWTSLGAGGTSGNRRVCAIDDDDAFLEIPAAGISSNLEIGESLTCLEKLKISSSKIRPDIGRPAGRCRKTPDGRRLENKNELAG